MLMLVSVNAVAGRDCGSGVACESNKYNSEPRAYHRPHPYVIADKLESMCITKMSDCSVKQSGASYFYQFSYGYIESRVMIFSNGKTSRYKTKGVENVGEFVDVSELKKENANAATKVTDDKVRDEFSAGIRSCISKKEVWLNTYGLCK